MPEFFMSVFSGDNLDLCFFCFHQKRRKPCVNKEKGSEMHWFKKSKCTDELGWIVGKDGLRLEKWTFQARHSITQFVCLHPLSFGHAVRTPATSIVNDRTTEVTDGTRIHTKCGYPVCVLQMIPAPSYRSSKTFFVSPQILISHKKDSGNVHHNSIWAPKEWQSCRKYWENAQPQKRNCWKDDGACISDSCHVPCVQKGYPHQEKWFAIKHK